MSERELKRKFIKTFSRFVWQHVEASTLELLCVALHFSFQRQTCLHRHTARRKKSRLSSVDLFEYKYTIKSLIIAIRLKYQSPPCSKYATKISEINNLQETHLKNTQESR